SWVDRNGSRVEDFGRARARRRGTATAETTGAAGLAQSLDRGLDDRHALPEIGFWVQGGVDLGFRKELRDLRLRQEGLAKLDRFCPSGLRGLPHELVRLLTTESLAGTAIITASLMTCQCLCGL